MMKKTPLSRPAASAIAAFLVLSTPAAFAQTAPVAEPSPPIVMVPPVAAPAPAPTVSAPVAAPAPAPVIRVPLDLPAEPVAKAAPRPAAKAAPRPAPKAAPRAAAAERTAPVPVEAAPVAAAASTIAAPPADVTPIAPVTDRAPAAATTEATPANDGFPWELAGGAAALLLAGGIGLTFARRRRRVLAAADAWEFREADAETEWVPAAPAATPVAAREAEPMVNPEPIPAPAPVEEPVHRTSPAFAAAPSGSMGRHEAMALVGPTADNPFATLSKRLKRARFLDRKERVAYEETLAAQDAPQEPARTPVSAWEIAQRPAPAPAQQDVRRPEPVARGLSHGFRRPDFARK